MFRPLIIVGAGGHGRVVADAAEALGYRDISFVDVNWPTKKLNLTWPVIANDASMWFAEADVFVAIGLNAARLQLVQDLLAKGAVVPTLVHPQAHVSKHAALGRGTFVAPMASVNVASKLGDAVIVNTGSSVDHDCQLADGVHVSPGARLAGTVTVGTETWIGIGASVREGTHIGRNVIVAAGAAVVNSVADNLTVLGVPARPEK